eukprot:SAG31_NODE_1003_length_10447_cov_3.491593_4_plen_89_part_00
MVRGTERLEAQKVNDELQAQLRAQVRCLFSVGYEQSYLQPSDCLHTQQRDQEAHDALVAQVEGLFNLGVGSAAIRDYVRFTVAVHQRN